MTEDLEKKLDELLGMKKHLDEMTREKEKRMTESTLRRYAFKTKLVWGLFILGVFIGLGLVTFGLILIQKFDLTLNISAPTLIVAGLLVIAFAKVSFAARYARLSILREMKEFELRMTQMLKK